MCVITWAMAFVLIIQAGLAEPPRQQAATSDPAGTPFTAVLHGGYTDTAGVLRGAKVTILHRCGQVVWDDFDPSLHPWLLRAGRFAGRNVLLIGVRKPTIFDPPERPRPFIYSLKPDGLGLRKVWLGTSLSRPFLTASFGDLDGVGEDELVALEFTADGGLALGAYRWEGFGIEGTARSDPIPNARELLCGNVWGGPAQEAVVLTCTDEGCRFLAFGIVSDRLLPVAQAQLAGCPPPDEWCLEPATSEHSGAVRARRSCHDSLIRFETWGDP